ncbi:F-box/kelch-repeat protein like [Capsicum chacoense]
MWNPTTRESRRIPHPNQSTSTERMRGSYNFCYLPCIDSYKIFRVGPRASNSNMEDTVIDIFSMKSNTWKAIGPLSPNCRYFFYGNIVMADGVAYMMQERENMNN